MVNKTYQNAIRIFEEHQGILRTAQAKRLGIDPPILGRMAAENLLVKEARGLYRLASQPPLSNPDLTQIALRVPAAIICLISALNFHGLTTQIPHRVYFALPQNTKAPRIDYPPIEVVYLTEKPYSSGVEIHEIDGISVRVYCREKTIADCYKFRAKVGLDVAIEALKDYLRQPKRDIRKLVEYAKINRVEKMMIPYLKALV